jgi:cytochrome c oxidase subunit 2
VKNRICATLALLIIGSSALFMPSATAQPAIRVVEISAKRFEFTPNLVTLKKDEPVTIRLTATDRAHGLLVKELGIDLDADKDRPDQVTITPKVAGSFVAICDHYCGSGHGNMKMTFIVE